MAVIWCYNQLTGPVADACKTLWAEDSVKQIYEDRAVTGIDDSSAYFWDKIDQIMESGFVPNETDILYVRYRTTGVIDQKFTIKKNVFHVFDVGGQVSWGYLPMYEWIYSVHITAFVCMCDVNMNWTEFTQKSERKKWINCFDSVTAVIFVASMSCYDEKMFEDQEKNSMVDQLELFEKICNEPVFVKTSMILFLNKKVCALIWIRAEYPITPCTPRFEQRVFTVLCVFRIYSKTNWRTAVQSLSVLILQAMMAKRRRLKKRVRILRVRLLRKTTSRMIRIFLRI